MGKLWKLFLAQFRLSPRAVCEMSSDRRDFHDWPDDPEMGGAWHFINYRCCRCGRSFTI